LENTSPCFVRGIFEQLEEHKIEHIFAHIGEKVVVIDVHTIEKALETNSKRWREQKHVEMNFITI